MRLTEWTAAAPHKESATPRVLAVVEPMLAMLGCEPDPSSWVVWGDDPGTRYTVFAPTDAGMVQVNVRVNVPGEGPRASGKLIRWNRMQLGDLAVEMQGGHRIVSFPLEGQILRGTDDSADLVTAFVLETLAALEGRPWVSQAARAATGQARAKSAGGGRSGASTSTGGKAVPMLEAPKGGSS